MGNTYFSKLFIKSGETASAANAAMTGTYATPTDYVIAPASNEVYVVTRMLVSLADSVGVDADAYGNAITLTNGITLAEKNASGVTNQIIPTYDPIKTNADWAKYCYDADLKEWGSGNEVLVVRWTFAKGGTNIKLNGRLGEYLALTLHDTFTGLAAHNAIVQGYSYEVA